MQLGPNNVKIYETVRSNEAMSEMLNIETVNKSHLMTFSGQDNSVKKQSIFLTKISQN